MSVSKSLIYHLVPAQYFQAQLQEQDYYPETFAEDGFIHCTSSLELLVQVANRYFDQLADDLLVLEIDQAQLTALVKFEPPKPPANSAAGQTSGYVDPDAFFPHLYGPLNREAIVSVFKLERNAGGRWQAEGRG